MIKYNQVYAFVFLLIFASLSISASVFPGVRPASTSPVGSDYTIWMVVSIILSICMIPGMVMFYGGLENTKNINRTFIKALSVVGILIFYWFFFGFSLVFGDSFGGIIGNPKTFFMFNGVGTYADKLIGDEVPLLVFALYQLKHLLIAALILTVFLVNKMSFRAFMATLALFVLFVYSPIAHAFWNPEGILNSIGAFDFAGGAVVHTVAGFTVLVGSLYFDNVGISKKLKSNTRSSNLTVLIGTGLLWVGWLSLSSGVTEWSLDNSLYAVVNIIMSSAASVLTWLLLEIVCNKKVRIESACLGAFAGLIAITPVAGVVSYGSSFAIGVFASVFGYLVLPWKFNSPIKTAIDTYALHWICGIWGLIAVGIFAEKGGLIEGSMDLFIIQLIAVFMVSEYTMAMSYFIYKVVDALAPRKVIEMEAENQVLSQGLL